jgi:aspartyl aminopeptidase
MFELEPSSPIYPTAEVNTRYQGVDVATIMTRMHSLDNSLTAKDVE